jgi:hypothetical protein
MDQLVYGITAVVALPFAILLFLACLSEIEALRVWIKDTAHGASGAHRQAGFLPHRLSRTQATLAKAR